MFLRTTLCPVCRDETDHEGQCLSCLLRVGLDAAADPETPRAFGDFEIDCYPDGSPWELGRGGMGVTYRATDTVLHRVVALKVIEMSLDTERPEAVRERFLREARSAAGLHHPNVAEVFQFGTSLETDHAYYAMEFIGGETLEARVRRRGPLPVEAAIETAVQVACALVSAAEQDLVHRDLKPGNIMLSPEDAPGPLHATVIDFGLAKAVANAENGSHLTDGGFVGTPAFASPEQFQGSPADVRSDIYSLAATIWYALTGSPPFDGRTLDETRDHPAREALPTAQLAARKVPGRLISLLRSALATDPAKRPASAQELLDALEACRPGRRVERKAAVWAIVLILAGVFWWMLRSTPSVPPAVSDRSVAVLPFDRFSKDDESALLADGMQAEVLTDLGRVASLKIISRSSTMPYRDPGQRNVRKIGEALGVAYVLEGSVQRIGRKIRVNTQLIDARNDNQVWVESFDRDESDLFAVETEISQSVAGQLQAIISPREQTAMAEVPTRDEGAYQLYLRARVRANDPNLVDSPAENAQTVSLLRQATARDPGFVRAYALMAEVQALTYVQTRTSADGEEVRASAEAVAHLRPGSADANVALATYDYEVRRDYERAHEEFAAVARELPSDARACHYLALIERRQGRWEEAVEHDRRSRELDPENDLYFKTSFTLLYGLRRFPELLTLIDRRLASHPTLLQLHCCKAAILLDWKADTHAARAELALLSPDMTHGSQATEQRLLCDCFERDWAAATYDLAACPEEIFGEPRALEEGSLDRYKGDTSAAIAAYMVSRPLIEAAVGENPGDYGPLGTLATVDALLGRKETALEEGRRMFALVKPGDTLDAPQVKSTWATVLNFAGETDEAILVLQSVVGQPFGPTYGDLRANPDWDALRGDPRFEALVASLAPKPGS